MTWIVTANSNLCRIYHLNKHIAETALVKEINHAENKLKKSVFLTTDRAGHYQADSTSGGSYSPHTDPKTVEIDNFAREIAHTLNQARNQNAYQNLILIASAHMSGLLHQHLDKHVVVLIRNEIQKDVMPLSHPEFLKFLQKNKVCDLDHS